MKNIKIFFYLLLLAHKRSDTKTIEEKRSECAENYYLNHQEDYPNQSLDEVSELILPQKVAQSLYICYQVYYSIYSLELTTCNNISPPDYIRNLIISSCKKLHLSVIPSVKTCFLFWVKNSFSKISISAQKFNEQVFKDSIKLDIYESIKNDPRIFIKKSLSVLVDELTDHSVQNLGIIQEYNGNEEMLTLATAKVHCIVDQYLHNVLKRPLDFKYEALSEDMYQKIMPLSIIEESILPENIEKIVSRLYEIFREISQHKKDDHMFDCRIVSKEDSKNPTEFELKPDRFKNCRAAADPNILSKVLDVEEFKFN